MLSRSNQKANSKAFSICVVVSFCWHVSLFSIVNITFPNLDAEYRGGDIKFLGSFLNEYDIFPFQEKVCKEKKRDNYIKIAKQNIISQDLVDYIKLVNYPQKPKEHFFISGFRDNEQYESATRQFSKITVEFQARVLPEAFSFDSEALPDLGIYFREGLPRPVKFNLLICKRGRVQFLKKEISSGNFDVDLRLQRALRRLVFDYSRFGRVHWRTLKLDFKNDSR